MFYCSCMAKTVEEIIDVECLGSSDKETHKAEIYEIFCGFNQPKEKMVFSGFVKDIPENLLNLKYTESTFDPTTKTHTVKYTNLESFEGKKLFQQLQIQRQEPLT